MHNMGPSEHGSSGTPHVPFRHAHFTPSGPHKESTPGHTHALYTQRPTQSTLWPMAHTRARVSTASEKEDEELTFGRHAQAELSTQ